MGNIENGEETSRDRIVAQDFWSSDADLLVYSSDGVEYRVFSRILIEASPIFRDMATVGKSVGKEPTVNQVTLEESAETLSRVFGFLYPVPDPSIPTFEILNRLMKAADKYILESVVHSLKRILVSPPFMGREPLRAYALACMYGYEAEAKTVSRCCLNIDIMHSAELYEELAMVSARDLLRLIKLHQTRAEAILGILNGSGPSPCTGPGSTLGIPVWWNEFKSRAKEEIRLRPVTDNIMQPGFLAACVNAATGCAQCPTNYFSNATQARLIQIKGLIDALPDTV